MAFGPEAAYQRLGLLAGHCDKSDPAALRRIVAGKQRNARQTTRDRKSTRLNSSHGYISYAVFCLKKKNTHSLTLPQAYALLASARAHLVLLVRCPVLLALRTSHSILLTSCSPSRVLAFFVVAPVP